MEHDHDPRSKHLDRPEVRQPRSGGSFDVVRLVMHRGGQRDGDVDWVDELQLRTLLVYSGPRYLGVYRPTVPPELARTALGEAQVWTAVQ